MDHILCCAAMRNFFQNLKIRLPDTVKAFCIKIAVLFIAWELLYGFLLLPARIPDEQITVLTAAGSAKLLNLIYPSDKLEFRAFKDNIPNQNNISNQNNIPNQKPLQIALPVNTMVAVYRNNKKVIGIADGCNAFELQVLFVGIILCMSRINKRTLFFIFCGVPLISVLNMLRCALIGWLNISRQIDLSIFAHHYLFKIILYGLIFFIWMVYAEKQSAHVTA